MNINTINYISFDSPIGIIILASYKDKICFLDFKEDNSNIEQNKKISKLKNLLKSDLINKENYILEQTKNQIEEYFLGKRKIFNSNLYLKGTDFQKKVWESLMEIPFGTTKSYKEQAIMINNQKAIRAVANANSLNNIAIIVPCHRVIGSNGTLTGYAGGIWRKKFLLDLEKSF